MLVEKHKIKSFHEVITEILYYYDPAELVGCNIPEDEYSSEASTIIGNLRKIEDIRSLKWMVYGVFEAYFSKENILPLSHECYRLISEKIWEEWEKVKKL